MWIKYLELQCNYIDVYKAYINDVPCHYVAVTMENMTFFFYQKGYLHRGTS